MKHQEPPNIYLLILNEKEQCENLTLTKTCL